MDTHTNRQAIMTAIKTTWPTIGLLFKSESLVSEVKRLTGIQYIYPDTVLRYLRKLKAEGTLDFDVRDKKSRIYYKK